MIPLNYHHLYYFWAVAREGGLTRAAERLHVSQSAVSSQIRMLEEALGQRLFIRERRSLRLTEAGRLAFGYAERIFSTGSELLATLKEGRREERQVLRIGAVATLSRNFVENFVRPLFNRQDLDLVLESGSLEELLTRLARHQLDLVLSNRRVLGEADAAWRCQRIARQRVSLVGAPRPSGQPFRFPQDLAGLPLIVPGHGSELRTAFDLLCERLDVRPTVVAEVDDMALLRLLARDTDAAAVLPSVVVRDELQGGVLQEYCGLPGVQESFFATRIKRQYQHPLLKALLDRREAEILGG